MMNKMLGKIGAYICLFSISFASVDATEVATLFQRQNQEEQQQPPPPPPMDNGCCPTPCCMSPWWGIVGGAVLGAAAGAVTAVAIGGRRGRTGPAGSTAPGVSPFTLDGNTLTFTPAATVVATLIAPGGTVTFFVARPDGAVFQEVVPFTALGLLTLPPITLPSMDGEYTTGIRVTGPTGTVVTVGTTGLITVAASRDGSTTSVLLAGPGAGAGGAITVVAATSGAEATAGFVYGPAPNP